MDPCPFIRVLVGNLALKIPVAARPAGSGVHPSTSPCFAKIRLNNLPPQTILIPLLPHDTDLPPPSPPLAFNIPAKTVTKSLFSHASRVKISIYTGRRGSTCGVNAGKLLGKVTVDLDRVEKDGAKGCVVKEGWIGVGKDGKGAQLHVTVRSEPDPRFVFEFDGEVECSPQVFQIQGSMRQPVFTCKFSCRSSGCGGGGSLRSSSLPMESNSGKWWLSTFGSRREPPVKERKGWSVTVHDLSGSPVALASMVTPFVASHGSDRVSRSNPGAWLILRPGEGTWKPWGRLEAWRERGGSSDGLGYRFEILPDTHMTSAGVMLAESTLSTGKGGRFSIDLTGNAALSAGCRSGAPSPGCSPRGSGDFGYGLWPFSSYRGFVMSSTVEGEGRCSKPTVEVGVQYVACSEDAAAFVALAAAIDLSMDACRLFSHKLRRELSLSEQR